MTTPVNPWFVDALIRPWWGRGDDDEAVDRYRDFDADNEAQVRGLIRAELAPSFRSWDDKSKERPSWPWPGSCRSTLSD